MMSELATKNFLATNLADLSDSDRELIIDEIGRILAYSELLHSRIAYLDGLKAHSSFADAKRSRLHFTREQLEAIVRDGILVSIDTGKLSFSNLKQLVHDVDALRDFISCLYETPEKHRHDSWAGAFHMPADITPVKVNIADITSDESKSSGFGGILELFQFKPGFAVGIVTILIAVIAGIAFINRPESPRPAGTASLVAHFDFSEGAINSLSDNGEQTELSSHVSNPFLASLFASGGFSDGDESANYFGSENAVSAGLSARLLDDSGHVVAEAKTDSGGVVEFEELPSGRFTLQLKGIEADYFAVVELSDDTGSFTRVTETLGYSLASVSDHPQYIDAITVRDSDGDKKADDKFALKLLGRPSNRQIGGRIIRRNDNITNVDINGDGDFEDFDDIKRIIEPDGDGIPSSEGDTDEDDDGIFDNVDDDIDGDGLLNKSDPDIDGDGLPNEDDDYPNGITPLDDFDPPTLPDGTTYSGIKTAKVYDPSTKSIEITFPAAVDPPLDEEGGEIRYVSYVIYWSFESPIDFDDCYTERVLINSYGTEGQIHTQRVQVLATDRPVYLAVRAWDYARPSNYDSNRKELVINPEDWQADLAPVVDVRVSDQTQIALEQITFDASESYDPDGGDIVSYEWDWNDDGVTDVSGPRQTRSWHLPGVYSVNCRITDDEGAEIGLDGPLEIYIKPVGWIDEAAVSGAKSWGGDGRDMAVGVDTDSDGNIYVVSNYEGKVDFNPGYGVNELSGNDNWDMALIKYNPEGAYEWSTTWRNDGFIEAARVGIDSNDNIYISGRFESVLDFDPGIGTHLEWATGRSHDAFLLKLDADAEFEWVATWGERGYDKATGIAFDSHDNVYTTGWYGYRTDFDPGPLEYYLDPGGDPSNTYALFVTKFDSEGYFQWARSWGANENTGNYGYNIAVDRNENVFVQGNYQHFTEIGGQSNVSIREEDEKSDTFLIKLASDGGFHWARMYGGTGLDKFGEISFTADDEVIVGAGTSSNLDFNAGFDDVEHPLPSEPSANILTFDSNGNLTDVKSWISSDPAIEFNIHAISGGGYIVEGSYINSLQFSTHGGQAELQNNPQHVPEERERDLFFGHILPNGRWDWFKTINAPADQSTISSVVDGDRLHIVGRYFSTLPASQIGFDDLVSVGNSDGYLLSIPLIEVPLAN
jgi:hypothetical protein